MRRALIVLLAAAAITACGDDATDYLNQSDPRYPPPPAGPVVLFNGPGNGGDSPVAIAADRYGNTFVVGLTWGVTATNDMTIVTYDSDLSEVWSASYDGPSNGNDIPVDVAVDPSGNVFVTGYSHSDETDDDMVTIKFDSTGAEQWVARYDDSAHVSDQPSAIAVDLEGNAYVTGNIEDTIGNAEYRSVLVSYAPDGSTRWTHLIDQAKLESPSSDVRSVGYAGVELAAIAPDPRGGVVVTGTRLHSPLYSRCGDNTTEDSANYITISYEADGARRWVAEYDGPCDHRAFLAIDDFDNEVNDAAALLAVDHEGSAYVAGYSGSRVRIVKYDGAGVEQWVADYVPPDGESLGSLGPLAVQPDYLKAIALDTQHKRLVLTLTSCCSQGEFTDMSFVATVAYGVDGELLWATKFDQGPAEDAGDVAVAPNGDVIVTTTAGTVDVTSDRFEQQIVTLAYDGEGQWLWEARHTKFVDSPLARRWPPNIVVHRDGRIVVSGTTAGGGTDRDFSTFSYRIP